MVAGGNFGGIFKGAPQFKPDRHRTLLADREFVTGKQRGLMHQAVHTVRYTVNTAFWDDLSGPVLPLQTVSLIACFHPNEPAILKISQMSDNRVSVHCPSAAFGTCLPQENAAGVLPS